MNSDGHLRDPTELNQFIHEIPVCTIENSINKDQDYVCVTVKCYTVCRDNAFALKQDATHTTHFI